MGLGETLFRSPYFRQDVAESYNARYKDLMENYASEYIDLTQKEIATSIAMV